MWFPCIFVFFTDFLLVFIFHSKWWLLKMVTMHEQFHIRFIYFYRYKNNIRFTKTKQYNKSGMEMSKKNGRTKQNKKKKVERNQFKWNHDRNTKFLGAKISLYLFRFKLMNMSFVCSAWYDMQCECTIKIKNRFKILIHYLISLCSHFSLHRTVVCVPLCIFVFFFSLYLDRFFSSTAILLVCMIGVEWKMVNQNAILGACLFWFFLVIFILCIHHCTNPYFEFVSLLIRKTFIGR